MIVLDTTVLIYATGSDHRLREPCRRLIDAIAGRRVSATTTVEVLQEFTHVRTRRQGRAAASSLASQFADLLAPLLSADEAVLRSGLDLYARSTRLGAFDAVLAAAALAAGAAALVSADTGFAEVTGLRHVVPTGDEVAALL